MYCSNWNHLYIIIYLLYSYVGLGLELGIGLQLGLGIRLGLRLRVGIGLRLGLGLRPLPSPYYMCHIRRHGIPHFTRGYRICVKSVRGIPNFKGSVNFHDTGLSSFNTKRYEKNPNYYICMNDNNSVPHQLSVLPKCN